jgi:hypothetical protein
VVGSSTSVVVAAMILIFFQSVQKYIVKMIEIAHYQQQQHETNHQDAAGEQDLDEVSTFITLLVESPS